MSTTSQIRNRSASITEIFSSLQGEGPHLGEKHLFIRFDVCNIHCEYCDELGKKGRQFDAASVLNSVRQLELEQGPHAFVSLSGGEPLVYVSFLEQLMPELKKQNAKTYLETNGILFEALKKVLPWTDVIAMDVKPASVTKE